MSNLGVVPKGQVILIFFASVRQFTYSRELQGFQGGGRGKQDLMKIRLMAFSNQGMREFDKSQKHELGCN